jgi:hypothetical protein
LRAPAGRSDKLARMVALQNPDMETLVRKLENLGAPE